MALANVTIDDRGRNAFEIRMSFDGDDDYPAGGTPNFKTVLRAAIKAAAAAATDANVRGQENVDIVDVVPGDCGAFLPAYDLTNDKLIVKDDDLVEVAPATDLSPTRFHVTALCK